MAATYPGGIVSLTTKNDGDTIFSSHVDALQDEMIAVETALINGFQHNISPLNDNSKDLGDSTHAWKDLYLKGNLKAAGQSVVFDNRIEDFRLTLTTAVPVTTADVTGATTIYCSPYAGNRIALYDGSAQWNVRTSAEFSIALGTLTNDLPYDIFCYDNAGVPTLEILAWSSKTARATALVLQDGVLVKSGATTRRYIGTFHTASTTTTEDSVTKRYLWNYYNRVRRPFLKRDATGSWTYTTATVRQARADTTNQVDLVVGWAEALLSLVLNVTCEPTVSANCVIGFGEDTTSSYDVRNVGGTSSAAGVYNQISASFNVYPAVGKHFYAWLEYSTATGTTTWYGTGNFGVANQGNGISGFIEG